MSRRRNVSRKRSRRTSRTRRTGGRMRSGRGTRRGGVRSYRAIEGQMKTVTVKEPTHESTDDALELDDLTHTELEDLAGPSDSRYFAPPRGNVPVAKGPFTTDSFTTDSLLAALPTTRTQPRGSKPPKRTLVDRLKAKFPNMLTSPPRPPPRPPRRTIKKKKKMKTTEIYVPDTPH